MSNFLDRQTHLIVTMYEGRPYINEAPLGQSLREAVDRVFSGEYKDVEAVIEMNPVENLCNDVTEDVAGEISNRSFEQESEPGASARLLLDQLEMPYWIDPVRAADEAYDGDFRIVKRAA